MTHDDRRGDVDASLPGGQTVPSVALRTETLVPAVGVVALRLRGTGVSELGVRARGVGGQGERGEQRRQF